MSFAASLVLVLAADIGQGNAVLVRTASHALLYDAGPRFSRESDAGHRVLVPLLRALERSSRVGSGDQRRAPSNPEQGTFGSS